VFKRTSVNVYLGFVALERSKQMQEINAKINRFFGIIIVLLIAVTKFNLKMSDLEHKTTTFYVPNTHSCATVRKGNIF